jgi:septum formation protein
MLPLILASASPRRKALLQSAGVQFEVIPAAIEEHVLADEPPLVYVCRVALEKAVTVAKLFPDRRVLAADSVVISPKNEILGKPGSLEEARHMLQKLSGAVHTVVTAVVLKEKRYRRKHVVSKVCFRSLQAAEIDWYLATGEPMDKAGSYGIQGEGVGLVRWVRGSYTNVVGLPLTETLKLLGENR